MTGSRMSDRNAITRRIGRSLHGGIPMLRLRADSAMPIVLCHRQRGEIISDDACEHDYQARESGVYRRYVSVRDDESQPVWLFLCKTDELAACLGPELGQLTVVEREALTIDAMWQAMNWRERQARAARRNTAIAQ